MPKLNNERGLTLVELLAVIVILGIISTIAFVSISGVIENSKKDAQIANALQLINAAKLYEVADGHINDSISLKKLQEADYLGEIVDPWTKKQMETGMVSRYNEFYVVHLIASDGNLKHNIGTEIVGFTDRQLREGRNTVWP